MTRWMKNLVKNLIIFCMMGSIYILIEILWRGYTYPSMFVVGGICGLLIGLIDEITPKMNIWLQCLLGALIVTAIEFISGCILNLWLKLNIWNYSYLKYNILGQISLLYSCFWFILSYPIIKIDNYVRSNIK